MQNDREYTLLDLPELLSAVLHIVYGDKKVTRGDRHNKVKLFDLINRVYAQKSEQFAKKKETRTELMKKIAQMEAELEALW